MLHLLRYTQTEQSKQFATKKAFFNNLHTIYEISMYDIIDILSTYKITPI